MSVIFFFFQAEDGIRDKLVTGVQTCALPILAFGITEKVSVPLRGDRCGSVCKTKLFLLALATVRCARAFGRLNDSTPEPVNRRVVTLVSTPVPGLIPFGELKSTIFSTGPSMSVVLPRLPN